MKITHKSAFQINHCQCSLCIFSKDSIPRKYNTILGLYFMSLWYTNFFFFFFFFAFQGHTHSILEVPRPRVRLDLQVLAYTTAIAIQGPSHVWDLHRSSWQHQISDPLSEVRDQTRILMDPSQICFCCTTMGTPFLKQNYLMSLMFPEKDYFIIT